MTEEQVQQPDASSNGHAPQTEGGDAAKSQIIVPSLSIMIHGPS